MMICKVVQATNRTFYTTNIISSGRFYILTTTKVTRNDGIQIPVRATANVQATDYGEMAEWLKAAPC